MKPFNPQYHMSFKTAAEALAYIDRLKADNPSPHWAPITFEVQPCAAGVYVGVDATTHGAQCFASEELCPRGFDVPLIGLHDDRCALRRTNGRMACDCASAAFSGEH